MASELDHYKKSIDAGNRPIPWYTYPAVEYVSSLDFKNESVLEWGSGNSTLFWSSVSKDVTSIEDNEDWYNKISSTMPENCRMVLRNTHESYADVSEFSKKYGVAIVDGKFRKKCVENVPKVLKDGGMVILDNADRHPVSTKMLRDMGLIQIDMPGFGSINDYTWTTSFFLTRDFSIDRKNPDLAPQPIGGLREFDDVIGLSL